MKAILILLLIVNSTLAIYWGLKLPTHAQNNDIAWVLIDLFFIALCIRSAGRNMKNLNEL